jgi:hypothetical protein
VIGDRCSRDHKTITRDDVGTFIVDNDARHLLKFPPFQLAGGVVLQRRTSDTGASRFCAATPEQIEALATSMVADMEALWNRRKVVTKRVKAVRQIAHAKIPDDAAGAAISAIAIDLEYQRDAERFCFYIEYDAIDEAFRPGIVLDYIPALAEGQGRRYMVPRGVGGRRAERDELRALAADGEIDEIAAAVVRAAPEGQMDVLGRLAIDYETNVAFMTDLGPVYALLFWRDGCIKAEIHAPGRLVQYGDMFEWTEEIFDDEDAHALIGWSLSSQIALPFDADCAIIKASHLCRGGVRFRIDMKRLLVNCSSGCIWDR